MQKNIIFSTEKARRLLRYVIVLVPCLLVWFCTVQAEEEYEFVLEWGSRGSGEGEFADILDVAVDAKGFVYVADYNNKRIQKFDGNGNFKLQWMVENYESRFDVDFCGPKFLTIDSAGNVYVAHDCRSLHKYDADGNFITSWHTEEYDHMKGIDLDSSDNVYAIIQVVNENQINKYDSFGSLLKQFIFAESSGDGELQVPWDLAVNSQGNFYVTDTGNGRIQKFDANSTFITKWGSPGTGEGEFQGINFITLDTGGNVYVSERAGARVQKFNADGDFITTWGKKSPTTQGRLSQPEGLAVDAEGNVYVADASDRIQKFSPASAIGDDDDDAAGDDDNDTGDDDNDEEDDCVATALLDGNDSQLGMLRQFRDEVLARNAVGRKLISLFYKNSACIKETILSNPVLKETFNAMLETIIPAINLVLKKNN